MGAGDDYLIKRQAYTNDQLYRILAAMAMLDGYALDKADYDAQVAALPEAAILGKRDKDSYTDHDRYRILTEKFIQEEWVADSSEMDALARSRGDIEACDQLIAFRDQRPGCIAHEWSKDFSCPCGLHWMKGDPNPPACRRDRLR